MGIRQDQNDRLLASLPLKKRGKFVGVANMQPAGKDNKRFIQAVEAGRNQFRSYSKGNQMTSQTANSARLLPAFIPPTREDSGLVDTSFDLDESQKDALDRLGHGQLVNLIGAAGTGKTTLVKRIIANMIYGGDGIDPIKIRVQGNGRLNIACVAFTGKAVQNMKGMLPDWMHPSCNTIHSLLEFAPVQEGESDDDSKSTMFAPRRDATNPLSESVIVVDEASMLGLELWHKLIDATLPNTKMILIGDLNQLVPVADQPLFPHVLHAGVNQLEGWNIAALTKVHRQKGAGANRIINTAHAILRGKRPVFDMELTHKGEVLKDNREEGNKDWHVVNITLPVIAKDAQKYLISWLHRFSKQSIEDDLNSKRKLFDPYSDFVLTPGNGYDEFAHSAPVQQFQLNKIMADLFNPQQAESKAYIIDAGREERVYRVGDRVMATKNERPDNDLRVTNGMMGVITSITNNGMWRGDKTRYGERDEVMVHREAAAKAAMGEELDFGDMDTLLSQVADANIGKGTDSEERQASHVIEVEYENGAKRVYASAAGVASTQLAYALTTHKAQGSQAETVIVVVHQAAKAQLNREWLYTAVTRASRRLIIFSTELGLKTAVTRQQLRGKDLETKVESYYSKAKQAGQYIRLTPNVME